MKKAWCLAVTMFCAAGAVTAQPSTTDQQAIHAINRLTFGPKPGDIERVKAMGVNAFIEEQLNPRSIGTTPEITALLAPSPTAQLSSEQIIADFRTRRQNAKAEKQRQEKEGGAEATEKKGNNPEAHYLQNIGKQFVSTKIERAVENPKQLEEVMTEFWFNHFNVCMTKGLDRVLIGPYEEQAIRPYALGKFRDLLAATSHHPAMLFYLDNWQNTAPGSQGARGKQNGLNENYARELMELHTLGVDGGYTQKDVVELARILTGFGIAGPRHRPSVQPVGNMGAYFDSSRHDYGDKVLLGHRISGSGEQEVEQALDILAKQPATAHHISYQLAQYFVCDKPPETLVKKLSTTFLKSDGDIKIVLRELFHSPEFWDPQYDYAKYKSPFRYAVSVLRACDAKPRNVDYIAQFLKLQGQPVYQCLTPDGYKNTKEAWLNPDSLLNRINLATAVASGRVPALLDSAPDYRELGYTISDSKFSTQTVSVIAKAPPALKSALVLGSPDFMRY